jgi:hypothetical protein
MTGPYSDDPDDQHNIAIHWDGSDVVTAGIEMNEPPSQRAPDAEPRPSLLQHYRYWLYTIVILVVVAGGAYVVGNAVYHPPSRMPALQFSTADPLYGTNASVASELDMVRQTFSAPEALKLQPAGRAFHIQLPRTVGDRLFGERDEAVTVFAASSPAGDFRFMELSGDGERIFAIEAPLGMSSRDQPTGVFLALDPADPVLGQLYRVLDAMRPAVHDLPTLDLSPDAVYVFGPYDKGDATVLRETVEGNTVMNYLTDGIAGADGEVSIAAPVFVVSGGPARGTINGIYQPDRRVIMEPLWGSHDSAVLGHELTHAYLDTVVGDKEGILSQAADYLDTAHPVLHGQVVGDLYERLSREGRAEESLAFLVGSIAAGQTKTVATQRLLENNGNLALSEAILYSDARLLVQFGLLPPCMAPDDASRGEITPAFYDRVRLACDGASPPPSR